MVVIVKEADLLVKNYLREFEDPARALLKIYFCFNKNVPSSKSEPKLLRSHNLMQKPLQTVFLCF
jgi:hypothetical protein